MGISKEMERDIVERPIVLTKIRVLRDFDEFDTPVEAGLEVEAYITRDGEAFMHDGEAWYVRPDTGEEWLSLPGDYEVIE